MSVFSETRLSMSYELGHRVLISGARKSGKTRLVASLLDTTGDFYQRIYYHNFFSPDRFGEQLSVNLQKRLITTDSAIETFIKRLQILLSLDKVGPTAVILDDFLPYSTMNDPMNFNYLMNNAERLEFTIILITPLHKLLSNSVMGKLDRVITSFSSIEYISNIIDRMDIKDCLNPYTELHLPLHEYQFACFAKLDKNKLIQFTLNPTTTIMNLYSGFVIHV